MAHHLMGRAHRSVVLEREEWSPLARHPRAVALDQQGESAMSECMNHPGVPVDVTGEDFGPPLCEDCARSAGLSAEPTGVAS
jgi:hypothetical protein